MPDPEYPFLSDCLGQKRKERHNDLVQFLARGIRDELGWRVKPAEVEMVGGDDRLSLRARGELWDVVMEDPRGVMWGIEVKRLTDEDGTDLGEIA